MKAFKTVAGLLRLRGGLYLITTLKNSWTVFMLFASPLNLSFPWRWMMRSSDDPANRKNRTFAFGMVTRYVLSKGSIGEDIVRIPPSRMICSRSVDYDLHA